MAEKIVIAEFEFDTRLAQKGIEEVTSKINQLKKTQDEAVKSLNGLTTELNRLSQVNSTFTNSEKAVGEELEKNKSKMAELKAEMQKQSQAIVALQSQLTSLNKERALTTEILSKTEKAERQLAFAQSEEGLELAKLRVQINDVNKSNRESAKIKLAALGAYQRLSAELGRYRTAAKNAGAEMIKLEASGQKNTKVWNKFNQEFSEAEKKANALDASIKKLDASLGQSQRNVGNYPNSLAGGFQKLGDQMKSNTGIIGKLGGSMLGISGQLVAGFGVVGGIQLLTSVMRSSFNMVKEFDGAMAELAGVLETPKNQLTDMRDLFLDLGGSTAFTATEIAKASTELARLGFDQQKISDSIKDVLNGTIAFQTELPAVAELAAGTLNAFGMEASQTGEVMNILAASANKTAAGFSDFVVALPKVSAPAASLGISLERTSALLGLLRDNSIAAESAGTGLRNIFLTSSKMGITYEEALQKVASSTNMLSTATEMFGKENAVQAVILAKNINKFDEYTQAVTNQGDALQFLVDEQMNTVAGSIKLLESAWEGFILSIESGDGIMADLFKSIIDDVTGIIVGVTDISKNIKEVFSSINSVLTDLGVNIDGLNNKKIMPSALTNLKQVIELIKLATDVIKKLTTEISSNLKEDEELKKAIDYVKVAFDNMQKALKPLTDLLVDASGKTNILSKVAKVMADIISFNVKVLAKLIGTIANTISKISNLITSNSTLSKSFEYLSIAITSPTTAFKALFNAGSTALTGLANLVSKMAPKIKAALLDALNPFATSDFSFIANDIKNYANSIASSFGNVFEDKKFQIKINQVKDVMETVDNVVFKAQSGYIEDILGNINTSVNNSDTTTSSATTPASQKKSKGSTKADPKATKEAKEQLKVLQSLSDAQIAILNSAMDEYRKRNKQILAENGELTKDILKQAVDRISSEAELNIQAQDEELRRQIAEAELKIKNTQEREDKINALISESAKKRVEIEAKALEEEKAIKDKYEKQLKAKQAEEFAKKIEDMKEQGVHELLIKKEQILEEKAQNIKRNEIRNELDKIDVLEHAIEMGEITGELDEATLERRATLNAKLYDIDYQYKASLLQLEVDAKYAQLMAYAQMAQGMAQIMGEETIAGKAMAIASTTIKTYVAIMNTLGAFSEVPIPGYAIAQAVATGAFGFAQVAKIAGLDVGTATEGIKNLGEGVVDSIQLSTLNKDTPNQGYFKGGYTGDKSIYEEAGVVHGQEVVFNNEDVKAFGGWQNLEMLRPTSAMFRGFPLTSQMVLSPQIMGKENAIINSLDITEAIKAGLNANTLAKELAASVYQGALAGSQQGTQVGSQQGISELNRNQNIRNGAGF